jgi:peroxiredoxin Q/BCP
MARPRSSGKSRSASKSRKSKGNKAKAKRKTSSRKTPAKARRKPRARPKAKPARSRTKAKPARSRTKARPVRAGRKTGLKPSRPASRASGGARGPDRNRSYDLEMEPSVQDAEISLDRHPAAPPKRRGGRSSVNSADYPGESLTVGMEAPDFSLPSTLGRPVTLSEFRGKRVVLYFYPKDDTPGCTMEACAFRDSIPRIDAKGAVVLGISLDDELSHQRFLEKYNLNFPLLSDKEAAVSRKYGTYKEKSLYGRSFWGIERTTFVIDRDGKVEHVFRRVKVEGHAEEVMATLAV